MKLLLKNVRLAFPALYEPRAMDAESKARYSALFLLPPDHPQLKEIEAAIDTAANEKWDKKAAQHLKALRTSDRTCLHDGDTKAQYDGFEGNLFVSAAAAGDGAPPTVVDRDRTKLTKESGKPYAGCYVNASIEIYAQDNAYGKRINASLRGVQFAKDGDAFGGGRPAAADEFEELESEDDDFV
jgi:hypothetical protein